MSILNVNKINPVGGGSTITIAGIASVTNNLTATNISAGSSVTANAFYGSGANLTGITQTTINSNGANRIITGSGSANTLNGQTNLTFDGDKIVAMNHLCELGTLAAGDTSENGLTCARWYGTEFDLSNMMHTGEAIATRNASNKWYHIVLVGQTITHEGQTSSTTMFYYKIQSSSYLFSMSFTVF